MRVPHFLLFTLGLSASLALFGCSRESSVKENVNLKNNHSRVFIFDSPIVDPTAFADSMANVAVAEGDTIPDTLTVTVNDTEIVGFCCFCICRFGIFNHTAFNYKCIFISCAVCFKKCCFIIFVEELLVAECLNVFVDPVKKCGIALADCGSDCILASE